MANKIVIFHHFLKKKNKVKRKLIYILMTINCTIIQKFPRTHLWVQRKPDLMVPSWTWAPHTFTEYARESVTANGSPSGTATTNTVTPMIKYFTSSLAWLLFQPDPRITYVSTQNRITNITTVSMAIMEPKTQTKNINLFRFYFSTNSTVSYKYNILKLI